MKPLPTDLSSKLMTVADAATDGPGLDMSIDALAKKADVPRATLYYYFSGRDDLLQFYVSEMMRNGQERIASALSDGGSAVDRLERVMLAILETFESFPRICVEMSAAMRTLSDYGPVMAEMERGTIAPIVMTMAEGNESGDLAIDDPTSAALLLLGGFHMVATMDILRTGGVDAAARAETLVPQLMRGFRAR